MEDKKPTIKDIKREEQELQSLIQSKERLLQSLEDVEEKIYRLETNYLEFTANTGNIVKGFDRYLVETVTNNNPNHISNQMKRARGAIDPEDRIFSSSAATSSEKKNERKGQLGIFTYVNSTRIKVDNNLKHNGDKHKGNTPTPVKLQNNKNHKSNTFEKSRPPKNCNLPKIKLKVQVRSPGKSPNSNDELDV